ncbi:MAG: hypothetical protein QE271_05380 [Bacteriovoracaceae bacterium]|nr:hypothetical protein [Bacteriovoracaceae bacterium]
MFFSKLIFLLMFLGTTPLIHAKTASANFAAELKYVQKSLHANNDGERTGSGGDAFACRNSTGQYYGYELWDYHEARSEGLKIQIGGKKLSVSQKVKLLLERVKKLDNNVYRNLNLIVSLKDFSSVDTFVSLKSKIITFNTDPADELTEIEDSDGLIKPAKNCGLIQAAVQNTGKFSPGRSIITIKTRVASKLSSDDYAGLIFHELMIFARNLFTKEKLVNTEFIRKYNVMIANETYNNQDILNELEMSAEELYLNYIYNLGHATSAQLSFNTLGLYFPNIALSNQLNQYFNSGLSRMIYLSHLQTTSYDSKEFFIRIENAKDIDNMFISSKTPFEKIPPMTGFDNERESSSDIDSLSEFELTAYFPIIESEKKGTLKIYNRLNKKNYEKDNQAYTYWESTSSETQTLYFEDGKIIQANKDDELWLKQLSVGSMPKYAAVILHREINESEKIHLGLSTIESPTYIQNCMYGKGTRIELEFNYVKNAILFCLSENR